MFDLVVGFVVVRVSCIIQLSMVLYWQFQLLFKRHADICKKFYSDYRRANRRYLVAARTLYTAHLDAKRHLDDNLSIIPFFLFATSFLFLVSAVTFVVLHNADFSPYFIPLGVTPFVIYLFIAMFITCKLCSDATDAFEDARLILSRILLDGAPDETYAITYERQTLYRLISTELPFEATGWKLFNLNRQLILSFANSVIPFAVMIITSASQLKIN